MAPLTTAPSRSHVMTSTSIPMSTTSSSAPKSLGDEKYYKRRHQKRKEQQRNILTLIFVTACVLTYTIRSLSSSSLKVIAPKQISGDEAEQRFRKLRQVHEQHHKNYQKQQKQQLQQQQQGQGQQGSGNRAATLIGRRTRERPPGEQEEEDGQTGSGGGFLQNMLGGNNESNRRHDELIEKLNNDLKELDNAVIDNVKGNIRWLKPQLLISFDRNNPNPLLEEPEHQRKRNAKKNKSSGGLSGIFSTLTGGVDTGINRDDFFKVKRKKQPKMAWESEPEATESNFKPPKVDYTKHNYVYPKIEYDVPVNQPDEILYPKLMTLQELMDRWPQDDIGIDNPPDPFEEVLMHFDYQNPKDLAAAHRYRDAKLPFKMYNIPEINDATEKWTDEYVSSQFDGLLKNGGGGGSGVGSYLKISGMPPAQGSCQESRNNFFAFFTAPHWGVEDMGIPPTRNNDWTYKKWSQHAKYADTIGLNAEQPHFYWQAGVDREERRLPKDQWTFISRDLPSFSSPTKTFFVFNPEEQKGIQCRFGERGVTAATHFDAGRNMIAMVTGAKRYVLSPPNQCAKLGIVTARGHGIFRHSLLNFGHLNYMHNETILNDPTNPISSEEYDWLKVSGEALALDTVLKAGEVLYLPSHWFHYITSIQKSSQCNVRSGVDIEGDDVFGGKVDVTAKCLPY